MRLRSLRCAGLAGASLSLFASVVSAQLVAGNDQSAASLWLVDVSGASPPRELLGAGSFATAWGLAADNANATLYWNNGTQLSRASYTSSGQLSPVNVGTITLIGTGTQTVSSVTGLAFAGGNLIGYKSTGSGTAFPVGFYTINPATATATLLAAAPSTDFGGFDFDPATNTFYGANDTTATTTVPGGRGIYRIDNLLSGTPTYTELADYPGTDADIDGLAAGGGRLWLVNDNSTAGQGTYVFNLTTNSFEAPLANVFTGTNGIFSGGAWAPGLIPEPTSVALIATGALALRRRARRQ